ncbi:hypothetical protein DIPPA_24104 [Diplonema papillatum]|nr:hypothetical protein DIPPA_24104 [Diplonema papillatum]
MCCRHHHHANDGQPIAVCTEHSTTKCGECKTAAACCRSGHHAWPHAWQGTCQECKRLPTLTQRRPAACCSRGHHQSNKPNVQSTPGRNKKKRPSSPTQVGVQRETPLGKRAARAPLAGNEKGDGGNRTGDQEAATNARNQRTTSAEEEGAWHPEEGPIKRKKTKATTPDSGVHRRKKKVPRASSSQKRPGTTGTPMPSKVKNGHTCPPSYSPTQSLESQENRTPLAPQMLDLDDAMAGDDVIR